MVLLVLLLAATLAPTGPAGAKDKRELKVMSYNVYLGAGLGPAVEATSLGELLRAVTQIWSTVQATDFPARSEAVADIVATHAPDLIGLQEVTNWTTSGPTDPGLDFLAILLNDLEDRGLSYSVAAVSENALIGPVPLLAPCSGPLFSCALTLQDRDVILVNEATPDLHVFGPRSGLFDAQAAFASPVGDISFDRGWALVDGRFQGKKFRFVNTHLETEGFPEIQEAQTAEFLAGPAKAGGAVIAVGDFNSSADGSDTRSYAMLTKSYFRDAWTTAKGDGFTCCQNGALTNPTSRLSTRIDLILTHAAVRPLHAEVVGDDPFQAVAPHWPSDHAGVVAVLRLH